jgi:C-terminal processing protease CtpA/Prc
MGAALGARQQRGDYDNITEARAFANALTADLRETGHDKHLRVNTGDTPHPSMPSSGAPSAEQEADMLKQVAVHGYGIAKADILAGNVGYLDVRAFVRVQWAAPAITAAMTQLAASDALIIDMRNNGGGDPAGVAFLCSYLFDQRTHLNDMYWRDGDRTQQFWTEDNLPGKRYGQHKAVYVLTGPRTFSGGEELSYDLQQLMRATLIGETTGGGANPGRMRILTPYFAAFIPNGRAINPISGTSWEGTGVVPDISVPAADALATAHKLALERLAAASADPQTVAKLRATLSELP